MKTIIIYHSEHHGNTKKLADAIADRYDAILISDRETDHINLSDYDLIGFASGIYYQKFHENILKYAQDKLPHSKNVFFLYTCGIKRKSYTDAIRQIAESKCSRIAGEYGCLGFDTFGPFKLIGGIAKGRPDENDISGAISFFDSILS